MTHRTSQNDVLPLAKCPFSKLWTDLNQTLFELNTNHFVAEAGLNNLPKFVDFVSEKGCESQGCRNEDLNSYIFEEATRIYQKCNIF